MKVILPLCFNLIICHHNKNIIILDQFTYHEPKFSSNPEIVLPTIKGILSKLTFTGVSPKMF